MQEKRKNFLLWIAVLLAVALGAFGAHFVLPLRDQPLANATVLEEPRQLPEFDLLDHNDAAFTQNDFVGRWSLVFFGFTHCPDICPTTLGHLARANTLLGDLPASDQPEVVFVSVDPMRDSSARLKPYIGSFDPEFTGLTGDLTEIQALTTALGVAVHYQRQENSYTVDHTAAVFLIDPDAALAAIFDAPHEPRMLATDYRRIVRSR